MRRGIESRCCRPDDLSPNSRSRYFVVSVNLNVIALGDFLWEMCHVPFSVEYRPTNLTVPIPDFNYPDVNGDAGGDGGGGMVAGKRKRVCTYGRERDWFLDGKWQLGMWL